MTSAEKIQVAAMVFAFLTALGAGGWKAVAFAVGALREESQATRTAQHERDVVALAAQEKRDAISQQNKMELLATNAKHAESYAAVSQSFNEALNSVKEMHSDYKRDTDRKAG